MLFRHDLARAIPDVLAAPPKARIETGPESASQVPKSTSESGAPSPSGFVVERPPPGLARGKYPTSPLTIGLLGTTLVLGALLYYFLRFRKPRS